MRSLPGHRRRDKGDEACAIGAVGVGDVVGLAQPESAFSVVAELLDQGGEGRLTPIFAGPDDTSVLPQTDDVADPDGANGPSFVTFIAAAVAGE